MFLCHVGVTIVSAAPTEGPLLNRLIKYTQMAVTTAEEFAFLHVGRGSSLSSSYPEIFHCQTTPVLCCGELNVPLLTAQHLPSILSGLSCFLPPQPLPFCSTLSLR